MVAKFVAVMLRFATAFCGTAWHIVKRGKRTKLVKSMSYTQLDT